jgi:CHRD domain
MRLSTTCMVIALLACTFTTAQESFPATHLARLDILEPHPNAGTIGGVAIIAMNPASGAVQVRVTAASAGDAPGALLLQYRGPDGTTVRVSAVPFEANTPTLTTTFALSAPGFAASIDSGWVWLAITRRSDQIPYADGPITTIPSAVAPEPSGKEVVPPVSGTEGVAHCALTFDPQTNLFRYTAWWLDLSGPATAARIRRAAAGSNGPILFEMPLTPGSEQSIGTWANASPDVREAIVKGELYFEVTTAAHPNGELRGQIYTVEGFTAAIEPENEAPPVVGAASGSAYLLITAHGTDEVFNKLQGVIGNLSGPMTAAHIHRGAIGQSGPAAVTLERPTSTTIDLELASGSAGGALKDDIVNEIRAERTYVNVHTAVNVDGEARGQLIPARTRLVTAPEASVSATAERAGFAAMYDRGNRTITLTIDRAARESSIALHAADGRVVRTMTCDGSRCEISAAGLPAGLYFVRLQGIRVGAPVMVMP